jgi:hypothetical protein
MVKGCEEMANFEGQVDEETIKKAFLEKEDLIL